LKEKEVVMMIRSVLKDDFYDPVIAPVLTITFEMPLEKTVLWDMLD
jgi:hypothetical protein